MSNDAGTDQALIIIEPEDRQYLEETAAAEGVEVQFVDEEGFLDPLSISVIVIGGSAAIGTVTYLLDRRKGGQVFDMRDGAPKAEYRSKDVAYGLVKIVAADGKVTVEVKEPRGLIGQVIDAVKGIIVGLAGANASEVAGAVKDAVAAASNGQATVTTEPVAA